MLQKSILAALSFASVFSVSAQQKLIDNTFVKSIKDGLVLIRQDYQLVDDNEGEVKNIADKEYWSRTYHLAARIGDDSFLIPGEAVRPWIKESFSKNDRFHPAISSTAIRRIDGTEFESIDFDADMLTELQPNRMYLMPGSEESGMSLISREGNVKGYMIWAITTPTLSDENELSKFEFSISPISYNLIESKGLYDVSVNVPEDAIGGFFLAPSILRPGLIDMCIIGHFQKINGIWRLVIPDSGTEVKATSYNGMGESIWLDSVMDGMDRAMSDFVTSIGIDF